MKSERLVEWVKEQVSFHVLVNEPSYDGEVLREPVTWRTVAVTLPNYTEPFNAAVLFTGPIQARGNEKPLYTIVSDGMAVLQDVMRMGMEVLVINPGTDEVVLSHSAIREFFLEYAMQRLMREGGAWALTVEDTPVIVRIRDKFRAMPIYLREQDASELATRAIGDYPAKAVFWDFKEIRDRVKRAGADAAFLQVGYPEEISIARPYLDGLCGGEDRGLLEALEQAIAESGGRADDPEVCRALSMVDEIWGLTTYGGDLISRHDTMDLFTSYQNAAQFLDQCDYNPALKVRMYQAPLLFDNLVEYNLGVCINRGGDLFWEGSKSWIKAVTLSRKAVH